jgi:hypothetical protein
MREYVVYLITKEVAESYYGKENKLFQLFLEEQRASGIHKKILGKQIKYITSLLAIHQLEEHLWTQLNHAYKWKYEDYAYTLESDKSSVRVEMHDRHLHLYSIGNLEGETVIFEALRKFEHHFLAMDFRLKKFGWLTPFKLSSRIC